MKLLRAKEILEARVKDFRPHFDPDERDAAKLGAEALKCVLEIRHHPFPDEVLQLPSETPE